MAGDYFGHCVGHLFCPECWASWQPAKYFGVVERIVSCCLVYHRTVRHESGGLVVLAVDDQVFYLMAGCFQDLEVYRVCVFGHGLEVLWPYLVEEYFPSAEGVLG